MDERIGTSIVGGFCEGPKLNSFTFNRNSNFLIQLLLSSAAKGEIL